MAQAPRSVIFVCLGNICRSPMAEAVFWHALASSSLAGEVRSDSAGTAGHHVGEAPRRSTLAVLREHGIATTDRARQVTREDFHRFDLLVAMDQANLADLRAMAPHGAIAKLALLRSYDAAASAGAEVPDPWGHPMDAFREVYTLRVAASTGLVHALAADA
jgi:protein-tyrosine phosphatase